MKTNNPILRLVSSFCVLVSSLVVGGSHLLAQTPTLPQFCGLITPTNHQVFSPAPANVYIHALIVDSNLVQAVEFFAGDTSLGLVTNTGGVLYTNTSSNNPFFVTWSNVSAGGYILRARAYDSTGITITSSPVSITVTSVPPKVVRPSVGIYSPTNNSVFLAPANLNVYAHAVESTGTVQTVEFFAGSTSLGVVSNSSQVVVSNISTALLFPLAWSNVLAGHYELRAVATDGNGITATSSVVQISVVTNLPPPPPPPSIPFVVGLYAPTNHQVFSPAPANIYVHAYVVDSNVVTTIEYFANDASIGLVTNIGGVLYTNTTSSNPFYIVWSNALAGSYTLKAVATDSAGLTATSPPISITVTSPPPPVVRPVVYIYSPTNNSVFLAPANLNLYARAVETPGTVQTVEFFANGTSLGVVSNSSQIVVSNISTVPVFPLAWPNVPAGTYELRAVATDAFGLTSTSSVVHISVVTNLPPPPPPPNIPFAVGLYAPTNHQVFSPAPANIYVHAYAVDSNVVTTIQYFANDASIGVVTNTGGVLYTNTTSGNPFYIVWSNVLAGSYTLKAVATDSAGLTATSPPISITVTSPPPPVVRPVVYIYSPTNNSVFLAPTNVNIYARAYESSGTVQTVEFFANGLSLGVVSNSSQIIVSNISTVPVFPLTWSNVPPGSYELKAIATDAGSLTSTSPVVHISVVTNLPPPPPPPNIPFIVSLFAPTNHQVFSPPANIYVHAAVIDSNVISTVEYFANDTSIGLVTNTGGLLYTNTSAGNPFYIIWSNVLAGSYTLRAVATDNAGLTATSSPVSITVTSAPPPPPAPTNIVVSIYATDPVAVEGSNCGCWYSPTSPITNYCSGTNTATFVVVRNGATNDSLMVPYHIGGTASNGVDYVTIPDSVTIPAGQRYAKITIDPLEDVDPTNQPYDTVILELSKPATNSVPPYSLGSSPRAAAVILEAGDLPIVPPTVRNLPGRTIHVSLPGTNGMNFCLQVSTNFTDWTALCTNTVLKGSAQFVDPDGDTTANRYYRVVPVATPPSY